ncbi:M20/M25/M40 family metallo-hydrolase [Granulosicoccus antarcticus]|uniref:Aminopeptidase YsdC n=1 Tax=Granulosicoccus antarcticus IMCC3135 TaxID=1192854 RepID=A0A2Z2P0S9_9GAMM|nr:M20/M25/M40 family metallo-hydrolase [Granulosicoccus antarcticus]ASJ73124.1 Putative aminopeptidase YsdC [Granulosicoccus antarcticus IMCC3135]
MSIVKPWTSPMPEEQFGLMRDIISAPSPVGFESAMTLGVLKPYFDGFMPDSWGMHKYVGNASVVWDSHPGEDKRFSIMLVGHADKIRLQIRKISSDGKIWINSDSFLPNTLVGHEVTVFSEEPDEPGQYRSLKGGTIEALGAIHFVNSDLSSGRKGIRPNSLYLDLQMHGRHRSEQVKRLGLRPGDPILLDRPIKQGFSPDTFTGAYLDNGLGCFITAEVARLVVEAGGTHNVRCLYAIASHEEIGRFGSRVLAGELKPDVLIAVDVNHDYVAAPGISNRKMQPLEMGKGFTLSTGSIVSEQLNVRIRQTAKKFDIPFQIDVTGRDTGTDGMASVFAGVDSAATSIGLPIRNMHTISESGHTGDVLAAVHVLKETILGMDTEDELRSVFRESHPRLDQTTSMTHQGPATSTGHKTSDSI